MSVQTGLDSVLQQPEPLSGQRLGLLLHPASVDRRMRHTLDLFRGRDSFEVTAVFGPQHGVRGETQDNMVEWQSHRDSRTGLPFFSLYGRHRHPTAEMLAEIDTVVVDLQDVGARYYTFVQTMFLLMRACAKNNRRVVVLDRPNPINGIQTEGPVLQPDFRSFVGLFPLPIRHGMTIGEIATYIKREFEPACRLSVVPMTGWKRESYFDATGLPWVLPSPNMPTLDTALVYPGMCLLEGTNLSEGRGTTRPFEICGAPWADGDRLKQRLDALALPGVHFRPLTFTATFHKWAGQETGGVQIHVLDRATFRPFLTAIAIIIELRRLGEGKFEWSPPPYEYEESLLPFDILCGTDEVRKMIESDSRLDEIRVSWTEGLQSFEEQRQKSLLY